MIEVKNLTKKYGNHVAVDHLSFRVEKGQIYGFLGPNGAGKSTTMNMITGYLAATEGEVTINGIDVKKDPEEAKRHIGYLPELPPLYMDMTVKEYLKFVAELKKVPAKERAEQLKLVMDMTQITDMQERLIKNLSKGYRQRVGLAQAILGFPEVIILDEPTVGLDPKQIIEIRDLIKNLAKNHTVILSSHILTEISAVCDHVMIISKGKLVASDTAEGLQKMMGGKKGELTLTVKGTVAQAEAVLEGIGGIDTKEINATGELVNIRIETVENADIREVLFYALAEHRLPIMAMSMEEKSLEDIFLELTGDAVTDEEPGEDSAQASESATEDESVAEVADKIQEEPEKVSVSREESAEKEEE